MVVSLSRFEKYAVSRGLTTAFVLTVALNDRIVIIIIIIIYELIAAQLIMRMISCASQPFTQGSYASSKPLNFKSPFSRPCKSLKFSFVHFGPWKSLNFILIEEHLIRSIGSIIVLFITEGKHSQTNFHKKWLPLRKKAHYYQNVFIVYLEPVLKVINKVLESPWKVLEFYGRKMCTYPVYKKLNK